MGAITRFLGETFNNVISVEGSSARARIARQRTRDLGNVSILCSPFQAVEFQKKFDIIFCIGVFEYSSAFVEGDRPHDAILEYFESILTPKGTLIIAIENQFGLKYFSASKEVHTGIIFDGVEGYPHYAKKARTFGYDELKEKLHNYFSSIDYYFPYPDYKLPSCVVSERLLDTVAAGELVGQCRMTDHRAYNRPIFDERLSLLELDRNNKLAFFANSFLVCAGKGMTQQVVASDLGVIFNSGRVPKFRTATRFVEGADGGVRVTKSLRSANESETEGRLTLRPQECPWVDGLSLDTELVKCVKRRDISFDELFAPVQVWASTLRRSATKSNGRDMLPGSKVDCIWRNSYVVEGECRFIDMEWEWDSPLSVEVLFIRSAFRFLKESLPTGDVRPDLQKGSLRSMITRIGAALDIRLTSRDFSEFRHIETEIAVVVFGADRSKSALRIQLTLFNRSILEVLGDIRRLKRKVQSKLVSILGLR